MDKKQINRIVKMLKETGSVACVINNTEHADCGLCCAKNVFKNYSGMDDEFFDVCYALNEENSPAGWCHDGTYWVYAAGV